MRFLLRALVLALRSSQAVNMHPRVLHQALSGLGMALSSGLAAVSGVRK